MTQRVTITRSTALSENRETNMTQLPDVQWAWEAE